MADWLVTWEFSHEGVEKARVKDAPRVYKKAVKREIENCDELLSRGYEKHERHQFPVQDLIGVRVLVRSLNDIAAVKRAIDELHDAGAEMYPLGNSEDFGLEDINEDPRGRGYRALHIDGSVSERNRDGLNVAVPFEIQVKTLAQHVFGQHTHDDAYVTDEQNQDPRYEMVYGLQRALAEQLNGIDLLLAQIEDVSATVRDDIARREVGEEVTPVSVWGVAYRQLGLKLREADSAALSEFAIRAGVETASALASLIDPSGDQAAAYADSFASRMHRRPSPRELLFGMLKPASSEDDLEDQLARPVPPNSLDDLDPDVELE